MQFRLYIDSHILSKVRSQKDFIPVCYQDLVKMRQARCVL